MAWIGLSLFNSVADVTTQVVAGVRYTMTVHTTMEEAVYIELFQALPETGAGGKRQVKYMVTAARVLSTAIHHSGNDLLISPDDEVSSEEAPLKTAGASWTHTLDD